MQISYIRRKTVTLLIFLFSVFVSSQAVFSESYTLQQLKELTGASFSWDPYRKIGLFTGDGKSVLFKPDTAWIILDGNAAQTSGSILYQDGRLLFSSRSAEDISLHFGRSMNRKGRYRVGLIMIDPGHGGEDTGAVSVYQEDGLTVPLEEKYINLDVSLRLKEYLEALYPDKTIVLTRTGDQYVSLEDRVKLTNKYQLDPYEGMLFIAVHTNASMNKKGNGFEIWHLPNDYRRHIIRKENGTPEEVIPVLNSLWEEEFTRESQGLAKSILDGMNTKIGKRSLNRGVKEESWFVVTNKKMASVLIEVGFLTNQDEAELLKDTGYLEDVTKGILSGIESFVSHFESEEASW